MAAIRSCGGAFVTNAPRSLWSGRVQSRLRNRHGAIIQSNGFSASPTDPPTPHGGKSRRAPPSPAPGSAAAPLRPLVVCGPSGVGKGTIIARYMERRSAETARPPGLPDFGFGVSHTTRRPRPGEVDGEHYHFVTRDFMRDKIESGPGSFFIEHAEVHGNAYGTSFRSVSDASGAAGDRQCLLDIDAEGVRSIKLFQSAQRSLTGKGGSVPEIDARFVFIAPPSVDALRERLVGRGTETPEALERRFRNAKAELEYGMEPGNFDAIVVNDDLDQACEDFDRVVREMYIG